MNVCLRILELQKKIPALQAEGRDYLIGPIQGLNAAAQLMSPRPRELDFEWLERVWTEVLIVSEKEYYRHLDVLVSELL
jgi:hypothetical protein